MNEATLALTRDKHQAWLQHVGEPAAKAYYSRTSTVHSGCHACLRVPVDAIRHLTCKACSRVVCPDCGACCCGRTKYQEGRRKGTIPEWSAALRKQHREAKKQRSVNVLSKALALAKLKKESGVAGK